MWPSSSLPNNKPRKKPVEFCLPPDFTVLIVDFQSTTRRCNPEDINSDSVQANFDNTGISADRLCGLVVRGPGSIPGATRFSEKYLERGPLSLVSTIEELLGRKSSDSGLEIWEYGRRDPSRWPRCTLYPQKLSLISPTSDGYSVDIVCSRTQAAEFF
jgi:hypothetical protein